MIFKGTTLVVDHRCRTTVNRDVNRCLSASREFTVVEAGPPMSGCANLPQDMRIWRGIVPMAVCKTSDAVLRNGLRTRTRLVLDSRQELSVPFAAVTQISGQSFVYAVGSLADLERRPGRTDLAVARKLPAGTSFALQTPVQLGPLQNNRYPVLKGLQAGTRVITTNLINLRNGAPVKVN
jgi:hypothetical protein